MYIYIYWCIYMYIHICIYVYIHIYIYINIYIYVYICIWVYIYTCIYAYVYTYTYIHIYIYSYIHICACIILPVFLRIKIQICMYVNTYTCTCIRVYIKYELVHACHVCRSRLWDFCTHKSHESLRHPFSQMKVSCTAFVAVPLNRRPGKLTVQWLSSNGVKEYSKNYLQ